MSINKEAIEEMVSVYDNVEVISIEENPISFPDEEVTFSFKFTFCNQEFTYTIAEDENGEPAIHIYEDTYFSLERDDFYFCVACDLVGRLEKVDKDDCLT